MKERHVLTADVARRAASGPYSFEPPSPLLYQRIGARPGIRRLVTAFYRRVLRDPGASDIRAMHSDIAAARVRFERFLVEWLGGPKSSARARKVPGLRARHFSFRVGAAEKSAWMRCMREALEETVPDAELRHELEAAFERAARGIVNRDPWTSE